MIGELKRDELRALIDKVKPTCTCGAVLHASNLEWYEHDAGTALDEDKGVAQWYYVNCRKCKHDYSLMHLQRKLGLSGVF